MYRRDDPRFRRTLNQISSNFETANETAQVGLFSFSENYVKPCFGALGQSLRPCLSTFEPCWGSFVENLQPCIGRCFPTARNDRRGPTGRHRGRTRGRLEHSFDFYDDWDEDENDALLALDDDEVNPIVGLENQPAHLHDRVSSLAATQPSRRRIFDYGSSGLPRRTTVGVPYEGGSNPTVAPNSSYFGFLDKLPFYGGGTNLRYKPSAADLKDRSGAKAASEDQLEAEIFEQDEEASTMLLGHGRKRSRTAGSEHTTDSYSSRGDLFPSDEEADAVPLDDEFDVALGTRISGDDASSGKKTGKKPSASRRSTRNNTKRLESPTSKSSLETPSSDIEDTTLPSIEDLKTEERKAREQEQAEVEKKRDAAQKLALEKGLATEPKPAEVIQSSNDPPAVVSMQTSPSEEGFGEQHTLDVESRHESTAIDGG